MDTFAEINVLFGPPPGDWTLNFIAHVPQEEAVYFEICGEP